MEPEIVSLLTRMVDAFEVMEDNGALLLQRDASDLSISEQQALLRALQQEMKEDRTCFPNGLLLFSPDHSFRRLTPSLYLGDEKKPCIQFTFAGLRYLFPFLRDFAAMLVESHGKFVRFRTLYDRYLARIALSIMVNVHEKEQTIQELYDIYYSEPGSVLYLRYHSDFEHHRTSLSSLS